MWIYLERKIQGYWTVQAGVFWRDHNFGVQMLLPVLQNDQRIVVSAVKLS